MCNCRQRVLYCLLGAVVLVVAVWCCTYSFAHDPKGLGYVLWKSGVYPLNPDRALDVMVGDGDRNKLVFGMTEAELRRKFGYLITPAEASSYLRWCLQTSPWRDSRVLFLRRSPWMVEFEGARASRLILMKGY